MAVWPFLRLQTVLPHPGGTPRGFRGSVRGGENGIGGSRRERPPALRSHGSPAPSTHRSPRHGWGNPPHGLPPAGGWDTQPAQAALHPAPPSARFKGSHKAPGARPPHHRPCHHPPPPHPGCPWNLPHDTPALTPLCPSSYLAVCAPEVCAAQGPPGPPCALQLMVWRQQHSCDSDPLLRMESSLHLGPVLKPTLALCSPVLLPPADRGPRAEVRVRTPLTFPAFPRPRPGPADQRPTSTEDLTALPSGHSGHHQRPRLLLASSLSMTLALPLSSHPSHRLFLVTSDCTASKIRTQASPSPPGGPCPFTCLPS